MKIKLIFIIYFVNLFSGCDKPQNILKSSIRQIDFGNTKKSGSYKVFFFLKNNGVNQIQIKSINSSCGCVIAIPEEDFIKPHDSIKVHLAYEPRKSGLDKQILTITDIKENYRINIPVSANVMP